MYVHGEKARNTATKSKGGSGKRGRYLPGETLVRRTDGRRPLFLAEVRKTNISEAEEKTDTKEPSGEGEEWAIGKPKTAKTSVYPLSRRVWGGKIRVT